MLVATGNVNFAGSWSSVWNTVSGQLGSITTVLDYIGVFIVVAAIAAYLWERRRGGSANHSKLIWSGVFGALLSAPGAIIPGILALIDFVANACIGIFPSSGAAAASTGTVQPAAMAALHQGVTLAHMVVSTGVLHILV